MSTPCPGSRQQEKGQSDLTSRHRAPWSPPTLPRLEVTSLGGPWSPIPPFEFHPSPGSGVGWELTLACTGPGSREQ